MKLYFIEADLGEGGLYSFPYYTFCVEAKNREEAEEKADKIVKEDYPDQYENMSFQTIKEVETLNDIANELLIIK